MTCFFDARWVGPHGIGRFADELSQRLVNQRLEVGGNPVSPLDPIRLMRLNFKRGDWILSPGINAPLIATVPYMITVHDLNHIDRLDNSSLLKRTYYRTVLSRLCHQARAVLTVSEYSRQRIIDWFGLNASKVFNVGNGVSPSFTESGPRHVRRNGYLLCVSNRRGHKNEFGLLTAFSRATLPEGLELILTGPPCSKLLEHARSLGVENRLVFSGTVSEEHLASLYRGALAMVFPSFYEGFGLPLVEAFASGVPVITSNVTSMPEIAGDAALLVNPFNIDEMAFAISRMCEDIGLRETLILRGAARVSSYTWDSVAARVKEVVKSVDVYPRAPLQW